MKLGHLAAATIVLSGFLIPACGGGGDDTEDTTGSAGTGGAGKAGASGGTSKGGSGGTAGTGGAGAAGTAGKGGGGSGGTAGKGGAGGTGGAGAGGAGAGGKGGAGAGGAGAGGAGAGGKGGAGGAGAGGAGAGGAGAGGTAGKGGGAGAGGAGAAGAAGTGGAGAGGAGAGGAGAGGAGAGGAGAGGAGAGGAGAGGAGAGGAGAGGAGAGGAGAGGAGGDAGAAGEAGSAGAGGSPNTCANTTCDPNATCSDGTGSPVCTCNGGYSGDGTTCTDDDECGVGGTNNCDANATCTNTPGSFTCACAGDYIGDGLTCALAVSCVDLITNVPTATTGLHMIDPDASGPGAAIQAYCDMTPGDAGWTLVMKAINDNFVYTDALWSDDTVINGADFDFTLDKTKAKYDTFGTVAFTSIRSSYVDDFSKHYDYTPATTYGSAKALFAGPGIQISATNPAPLDPYWDGIVGANAKSAFCETHVVVGINMQDFLGLAFLNDSSVCDWNGGARFGQRVNAFHGGTGNHSGQGWGAYSTIFPGYPAPFEITQLLWVRLDPVLGPVPAQRRGAAP